jgi:exosome complex RNA-binding protein Rrp42 (RNase PH superfamily)
MEYTPTEDMQIRMKSAELSAMVAARIATSFIAHDHTENHLIKPLELAPLFEKYIRTGEIDEQKIQVYRVVQ